MLRRPSAGLYYVFCDEKYFDQECALSIGIVLVPQQSWSCLDPTFQCLRAPTNCQRIERLRHVLNLVDGVGLVAWSKTTGIVENGRRDSTKDIAGMARNDNIWGIAMATGVYRALISARTTELEVSTADIHYDSFCFRVDHRAALYEALRDRISRDIRAARADGHAPSDFRPRIRRIEDTPKAGAGAKPTKYQAGVMMSHVLLQHSLQLQAEDSSGRIFWVDNSAIVTDFIEKFG